MHNSSMEVCPTALLVDLTEPKVNTPKTPGRKTPKRACRRLQELGATPLHQRRESLKLRAKHAADMDINQPKEEPRLDLLETCILDQETFDFDLSMSPDGSQSHICELKPKPDDEEIFFGPVGYREKCIAKAVEDDVVKPLSPLSTSDMVRLFKEAHTVAFHVKACGTPQRSQSSSQSSVGDFEMSPLVQRKRKLSSLELNSSPESVLRIKKLQLDSPVAIPSPKVESAAVMKPALQDVKAQSSSGVKRSASLRLPRPKFINKGPSARNKESQQDAPAPTRVRHHSTNQVKTPSNHTQPTPTRLSTAKKPCDGEQKAGSLSSLRKIPHLDRKELIRPGTFQRKSLAPSASKLPKGPLKATAPVTVMETDEPTTGRRLAQKRPASRLMSPKKSVSSSASSTPGHTPNSMRAKPNAASTPVKPDKHMNPKRLLSSPCVPSPRRQSTSSVQHAAAPNKRQSSCLPRVGRSMSFSSGTRPHLSSVSSNDSIQSSPGITGRGERKPISNLPVKAKRSLAQNAPSKENSRLQSPATRLASKLKPLRISNV